MEKKFKKGDEIVVAAEVSSIMFGNDVPLRIAVGHYISLPEFDQSTAVLCNTFVTSKKNIKSRELGITDVEIAASRILNLTLGESVFVKVLFECNIDDSICCARALRSDGISSYFTLPVSAILGCSDELDSDVPASDESDGAVPDGDVPVNSNSSHKAKISTIAINSIKRHMPEFLDGQKTGMSIIWNLTKVLLSYDEKTLKDLFGYSSVLDLLDNSNPDEVLDLLINNHSDGAFDLLTECARNIEKQSTKENRKKKGGTFSHGKEI